MVAKREESRAWVKLSLSSLFGRKTKLRGQDPERAVVKVVSGRGMDCALKTHNAACMRRTALICPVCDEDLFFEDCVLRCDECRIVVAACGD